MSITLTPPSEKPRIIAEIGCNHRGSIETAKELITTAALFCKVDVVKFQKRCNRELLTPDQYEAPHPNPMHSYGDTYGKHREYLEFTPEQHNELKDFTESLGIVYSTSVWDTTSAKEIAALEPELIKIPSACNLHYEMLDYLCNSYRGEIHLSTGMTTVDEIEQTISFFEERSRAKDVVLYACTSGYPVPAKDVCLLEIPRMIEKYGERVKSIGFSGHHLGISIDVAAVALGATWIERHFTLDRTWKGTDHAASLEPDGLRRLTRDCKMIVEALQVKSSEILPIEEVQRDKLKWKQR